MQSQISSLTQQLLTTTQQLETLTEQAKKIPELEQQNTHLLEEKAKWSDSEKTYNRVIGQLRADNEELRSNAPVALLKAIFAKMFGFINQKKKGGKNE